LHKEYLKGHQERLDEAMKKSQKSYADKKAEYDAKVAPFLAAINKRKAEIATYREGD
jgi:hypothetical protein